MQNSAEKSQTTPASLRARAGDAAALKLLAKIDHESSMRYATHLITAAYQVTKKRKSPKVLEQIRQHLSLWAQKKQESFEAIRR